MSPDVAAKVSQCVDYLSSTTSPTLSERTKLRQISSMLEEELVDTVKLRALVIETGTTMVSARKDWLNHCSVGLAFRWLIEAGVSYGHDDGLLLTDIGHFPGKAAAFSDGHLQETVWGPLRTKTNGKQVVSALSTAIAAELSSSHSPVNSIANHGRTFSDTLHMTFVQDLIFKAGTTQLDKELHLYLIEDSSKLIEWMMTVTGLQFNLLRKNELNILKTTFQQSRRLVSANSKLDLDSAEFLRAQWAGQLVSFEELVNVGNPIVLNSSPSGAWFGDASLKSHYEKWLAIHGLQQVQTDLNSAAGCISYKDAMRNSVTALVGAAFGVTILDIAFRLTGDSSQVTLEAIFRDYIIIQFLAGLTYTFTVKYFIRQQAKNHLDLVKYHKTAVISAYKSAKEIHLNNRRDARYLLLDLVSALDKLNAEAWRKSFDYIMSVAHKVCMAKSDRYASTKADMDRIRQQFDIIVKLLDEGRQTGGHRLRT
jgi:hypothetical protein